MNPVSSAASSGLRIASWPGTVLAVPKVARWGVRLSEDRATLGFTLPEGARFAEQAPHTHVPDELYLREFAELDATSPEAARDFCAHYGPVGRVVWTLGYTPDYPGHTDFYGDLTFEWGRTLSPWRKSFLGKAGDSMMIRPVTDVAVYQHVLKCMVAFWRTLKGDLDAAELARELTEALPPEPLDRWSPTARRRRAAAGFAASGCRPASSARGRSAGRPGRLALQRPQRGAAPFHVRFDPSEGGRPGPEVDIYAAMCLQLGNHITENATYRRCQNESCDRLFVRQRGRSVPARRDHRTEGVIYCSAACARTQSSREWRRRKRGQESRP